MAALKALWSSMSSSDIPFPTLDVYVDACRNESWADQRTLEYAGRMPAMLNRTQK